MNRVVELYIEDYLIDLDNSVTFPITKQIDDILDPGSIKTDFSKTISIPNTPNNNQIFGQIWSINKTVVTSANPNVGFYFNPSKKANYRLLYNGALYQEGYLKLSNIKRFDKTTWRYEINLYGQLGAFITALGDDLLTDSLTDSAWDQEFRIDKDSIRNLYLTIDGSNKSRHLSSAATLYAASDTIAEDLDPTTYYNDKFFDIIDSENGLYEISNKARVYDQQDYDLNNEFTETFMRNKLSYKQRFGCYTDMILRNFATEYGYTIDWSSIESSSNPYWYNTMVTSPILTKMTNLSVGDLSIISGSYSASLTPGSGVTLNVNYSSFTFPTNDFGFSATGSTIEIPTSPALKTYYFNQVDYDIDHDITLTGLPVVGATRTWSSHDTIGKGFILSFFTNFAFQLHLVDATTANASDDELTLQWRGVQTVGNSTAYVEVYNRNTSSWTTIQNYLATLSLNASVIIDADFSINSDTTKYYGTSGTTWLVASDATTLAYNVVGYDVDSAIKLKLTQVDDVVTGSLIPIRQLLPAIKTKDFFLSYVKMFGLYVEADEQTKTITIKNRDDYYTGYQILDWTDKLVRDRDINIVPLNFDKAFLRLGYKKKAESQLQKLYFDTYNEYYGDAIIDTGYEFNKETFDLFPNIVFEPIISADLTRTVLGYEDVSRLKAISINAKESSGKLTSYDPIGLIFCNRNRQIPVGYENKDFDGIYFNIVDPSPNMIQSGNIYHNKENQIVNTYNDGANLKFKYQGTIPDTAITANSIGTSFFYKQAGNRYPATDDFTTVTHSLDFYLPNEVYTTVTGGHYPATSTIYNRYWKNYIEDRYNINTKIVTAYFYLTPLDVINFSFKNFILFDGNLYSVNKIIDYDITSNVPTKVELVKVNDIDAYVDGVNKGYV